MTKPTKEMLDAARDWSVKKYGVGIGNDAAAGCWNAMCAAQPASDPLRDWQSAFGLARDAILNGRGPLEGEGMTSEQTNAVLAILDDEFDAITAPTVKGEKS